MTMVCPLRYIVAVVSVFVAVLVLIWGEYDKRKRKDGEIKSIWDLFTGKYLYDQWRKQAGQERIEAA